MVSQTSLPERAEWSDNVRESSNLHSQSLLSKDFRRSIQNRSDGKGLMHMAGHVLIIAVFACMQYCILWGGEEEEQSSPWKWWCWWGMLTLQAFCMAFLFMPFHECIHNTAFKSKTLNTVFGTIIGFVIFRPRCHYTFYHFNHHKFTGDPVNDPELQSSLIDIKLDSIAAYVTYLSGIPFWMERVVQIYGHGILGRVSEVEKRFLTASTEKVCLAEARKFVAMHALLGILSAIFPSSVGRAVLFLWIIPSFVAQPFLRFYLVAEHMGCPTGDSMLSNTRTTDTFTWYRLLAWNMPYHAEHHCFPFVPFHELPRLHNELLRIGEGGSAAAELGTACKPSGVGGYLGVHVGLLRSIISGKPFQN